MEDWTRFSQKKGDEMNAPTPEEIAAAQAVLDAAAQINRFPRGSHLVSTFDVLGESRLCLNSSGGDSKNLWRELTTEELRALTVIPELAKAIFK